MTTLAALLLAAAVATPAKDKDKAPAAKDPMTAEAFSGLPARQRFAFTHWGLRDPDSWLVRENRADTPLLFDAQGRPKPAAAAWEQGLRS